jgi:hypothetical protein
MALAFLPLALLMALPAAAVVAQAAPATTVGSVLALLQTSASPSPSSCLLGVVGCGTTPQDPGPCVLGVVLCGNNIVGQPTPCAGGLLCAPPSASPCVQQEVLCQGTILGPGTPPGGKPPAGGGKQTKGSGTTPATSEGLGTTNLAVALGVPPGVGLVPPLAEQLAGDPPNPNGLSDLLSLSIRDGLSPGGSQLWPALAMLQAVLLLVIVGAFAARRVVEASKLPVG